MVKKTEATKPPKDVDLPGMEDRAIKALEDVAASYADVRDRRMALNLEEAELKVMALKLMHRYDKTIYRHAGIEIRVIDGEEDVKVKVKKPAELEADDVTDGAASSTDAREADAG